MRSPISRFTWAGLFIALFGFIVLCLGFRVVGISGSITRDVWKEVATWIMAALLILVIRFGERLPLSSIRLGVAPWRQSLRQGMATLPDTGMAPAQPRTTRFRYGLTR